MARPSVRSYQVVYRIGSGPRTLSAAYQRRQDAHARLLALRAANPGRTVTGEVVVSSQSPEVVAHCLGVPPTVVGSRCPGCHRVLTRAAADAAQPVS